MKLHDTVAGVIVLVFGTAVALYARTFPPMPGQNIGPSLFPALIGIALAGLGTALIVSGARRGSAPSEAVDESTSDLPRPASGPRTAWGDRAARPRLAANFAAVVAVLLFYAVAVDWLGFFITGTAFLSVLMSAFGVRRAWILPLAGGVTLALHYAFYTVLNVPLPWGLLEAVAW